MRFIRSITLAAVVACNTGQASADVYAFTKNKVSWDSLPPHVQSGLVIGAWDALVTITNTPETSKYFADLSVCVGEMDLKTTDFVAIVDREYEALENWARPPVAMLLGGLRKVCLQHMNAARSMRGEPPLSP